MFNLFGNTTEKFQHIFCDELQNLISDDSNSGNFEIIDCRTPGEYHSGHIPGSKLIDLMDPAFKKGSDSWIRARPITYTAEAAAEV